MKVFFSKSFKQKFDKVVKKDKKLRKQIAKQFQLFTQDPRYPSLRLHKLRGHRSEQYSIWMASDLRAIAIRKKDHYIFFDLIHHDDY